MPAVMYSDGSLADLLLVCRLSKNPISHEMIDKKEHFVKMQGKEVLKHAVIRMSDSVLET